MTVTYFPPVNLGGPPDSRQVMEAITEGPAFVRTSRGGRWHQIRSGKLWMVEYDPDRLREAYELWCGQHASDHQGLMLSDEIPADEPLCATCHGRALGADPSRPDLIFLPRAHRRPKICPASQTRQYADDQGAWNRGTCLACGEVVKLRAHGGPWNGGWGVQRHAPGPGLPDPCPFHGWRHLTFSRDGAMCRCQMNDGPY